MRNIAAAIAANRFGLGARPGDAALIGTDAQGWLRAQLASPPARPAAPPPSATVIAETNRLRRERRNARFTAELAGGQEAAPPGTGLPAAPRQFGGYVRARFEEQVARQYAAAVSTPSPFRERLVHFWANHFAVSVDKQPLAAYAGLYIEEAIRPHVTGNFRALLRAAEQHPVMLMYLDNQVSIGPDSPAAVRVRRNQDREFGLNENLAREILELHTLGVDGGYTQADVTEFARVLTGWSVGGNNGPLRNRDTGRPGEFHFRALVHDPGSKQVLGQRIAAGGVEEGLGLLDFLAMHESTARHLAFKLARHFVADEPPPGLVARLARVYLEHDADLVPVYEALIEAEESWQAPLAKFKTPAEFMVSTLRALDREPPPVRGLISQLQQLGQRPMTPGSPAGWPDTAAEWLAGDPLLKRLEWSGALARRIGDRVDALALADAVLGPVAGHSTRQSIGRAESGAQALALLFAAPEFQRR